VLGLVARDSAGVYGSLQSIDGLAAIKDAQQFAAERVVEGVVAQEYGAQQSAEVHDRLIRAPKCLISALGSSKYRVLHRIIH
jgi:hypothetical protein